MTAQRRAPGTTPAPVEPCRCALCIALLAAASAAEQNVRQQRKMLTIVASDRRTPAA